jgi:hypothetical protein
MALTPTEQFCGHLRRIVMLMEQSDWAAAAAEAAEMEKLVATLPLELPQSEFCEAGELLARYEALGADLRQRTVVAMTQLGSARRAKVYTRLPYRP